jgi:hypothetical protein
MAWIYPRRAKRGYRYTRTGYNLDFSRLRSHLANDFEQPLHLRTIASPYDTFNVDDLQRTARRLIAARES